MRDDADSSSSKPGWGQTIQKPLVAVANKAMSDDMRYAAEFGVTPSARTRIAAGEGGADDELVDRSFN
jgi:phage terminase small subunit